MSQTDQYKENLLQNVRYTAKTLHGQCRVSSEGNQRHVTLIAMNGQSCVVWFPIDARVHNLEIADLKEAVKWIFGVEPFAELA